MDKGDGGDGCWDGDGDVDLCRFYSFEVAEAIRKLEYESKDTVFEQPRLLILACTAEYTVDVKQKSAHVGMDGVIAKVNLIGV